MWWLLTRVVQKKFNSIHFTGLAWWLSAGYFQACADALPFWAPLRVSRSFLQPPVGPASNFCAFCITKRSFLFFKCAKALANLVNGSTLWDLRCLLISLETYLTRWFVIWLGTGISYDVGQRWVWYHMISYKLHHMTLYLNGNFGLVRLAASYDIIWCCVAVP